MLRKSLFVLMVLTAFLFVACSNIGVGSTGSSNLGDYVWIDSNQNGIQDGEEVGLKDVRVRLYTDEGRTLVSSDTTGTDGRYRFNLIAEGTYKLQFILPLDDNEEGYYFTVADQGNDDTLDSDVLEDDSEGESDTIDGWTAEFTVGDGENFQWDAGVIHWTEEETAPTPEVAVAPTEIPIDPESESRYKILAVLLGGELSENGLAMYRMKSESTLGRANNVRNSPEDQEKEATGHTDILRHIAITLTSTQDAVERWFGSTDFPCGQGDYGFTVCGSGTFSAGRGVVISAEFAGEIPLEDPENQYQYGFVFDRDGDSTNNFKASPAFPGDFFDDTDLWYELAYHPAQGWMLRTTDVLAGYAQMSSGARAIINSNSITLVIPEAELSPETLLYRVTAFRHTGDFGLGPPFDWDADIAPPVHEPLLEMSEIDVVVQ